MKDENQKSKGFGFVCFKDPIHALKALDDYKDESGLYVREALSREQRQIELNKRTLSFKKSMQYLSLHVKGFKVSETIAEDLKIFFSPYGEIKNVKVTNSGSALVSFLDRDAARKAKESSNGV